jgi:glycosyltransferase involved in cell wall biosynthesis
MCAKELISIVIPTLNEKENIGRLLESIRLQTYRPLEVIVVDGCSTDGTPELVKDYADRYSTDEFWVKLFSECDFGSVRSQPNARNIGIRNASSKYIVFFDADFDLSVDNTLIENIAKYLKEYPWVGVRIKLLLDTTVEEALAVADVLWGGGYSHVHKYCAVRKELFDRLFDPCLGYGEDQDLFEYHFVKNKNINPIIIDALVGRHLPHTLREYMHQQLWYWSTFYAFAKKHSIDKLKYIIRTQYSAATTLLLITSLIISISLYSLIGILSLLFFLVTLISIIHRRYLKIYRRIPLQFRKIKVIMTLEVIELVLKPLFFIIGTLKYIFSTRERFKECYRSTIVSK